MRTAKITIALTILAIPLAFWSCVKEEPTIIPDVPVKFSIYLELSQYSDLNAVNNAIIYPNEGYDNNGVVIYRLNIEEFFAYDATCPQHITESTAVVLDDDPGFAICPHCETTYSLANFGQASSGHPLKRYKVSLNGNILRVYN
jgi:nitrite reductase/ring-hydroxylating ferredoxin subunit